MIESRLHFTPEAVFHVPRAWELKVLHTSHGEQVAMLLPAWIVNNFCGLWGMLSERIDETLPDSPPFPIIDMENYPSVLPENFGYLCELLSMNRELIKRTRQEIIAVLTDSQLSVHEVNEKLIKIRVEYFNHFDGLSDLAIRNQFDIHETDPEILFERIAEKIRELSLTSLFLNSQRFYEDSAIKAVLDKRTDPIDSKLLFDPLVSPICKRIAELLKGKSAEQMSKILEVERSTDEAFLKRSSEISEKLRGVREKIAKNPVDHFGIVGSKVTSTR